MSLYRLQRYANGDGDPIDTSDALAILNEVERLKKERYNAGLDTATSLIKEIVSEDVVAETLICGLENSKL